MKKWKKTLVLFLCALLVSNVIISDYERVEVKAEVATLTIVSGGLVLTLGGLATYQILANGGVVDKETFMRYYNADKAMFEQNAVDYINRKGYQFKTLNADAELITQIVQQHAIGNAEEAWQKIYAGGTLPPAEGIEEPWTDINVGNTAEQIQQYLDELRENQGGIQSPEEDPDHDGEDYNSAMKNFVKKWGVVFGLSLMLALGGAVVDNMAQQPQYEVTCNEANGLVDMDYSTTVTYKDRGIDYRETYTHSGTGICAYHYADHSLMIKSVQNDCDRIFDRYMNGVLMPGNHIEVQNNGSGSINLYPNVNGNLMTSIPIFENNEICEKYINGEISIEEALNYVPSIDDLIDSAKADKQDPIDNIEDIYKQADELGIEMGVDSVDDCIVKSVLDICDEVQPQTDESPVEEQDPVVDVTPIEDIIPWEVIKDTIKPSIEEPVKPPVIPVIDPETPVPPIDKPVEPVDPTDQGQLGGVIGTVFPFCIPFDLIYMFKELQSDPKVPYFEIPIVFKPLGLNYLWVIDFSKFEPVAKVFRVFSIIGFITSLILLTRRLIKG